MIEDLSDVVKQLHIITGPNGQCMCGVYGNETLTCSQMLSRVSEDIQKAMIQAHGGGTRIRKESDEHD